MRFRHPEAIRARIGQLLARCGEDPSAAFAAQYDALPLFRDLTGWTGLRADGVLIFVDDATRKVITALPETIISRSIAALQERYPEVMED